MGEVFTSLLLVSNLYYGVNCFLNLLQGNSPSFFWEKYRTSCRFFPSLDNFFESFLCHFYYEVFVIFLILTPDPSSLVLKMCLWAAWIPKSHLHTQCKASSSCTIGTFCGAGWVLSLQETLIFIPSDEGKKKKEKKKKNPFVCCQVLGAPKAPSPLTQSLKFLLLRIKTLN